MRLEVSKDRDPDAVPEDVDGCLHVFSERSGDKTRHRSHCARLAAVPLRSSPLTHDLSCYDLHCYNVGMLILLRPDSPGEGRTLSSQGDHIAGISVLWGVSPKWGTDSVWVRGVGFTDRRVGHGGRHHRPRGEAT